MKFSGRHLILLMILICSIALCSADLYPQEQEADVLKAIEYRSIGPTRQSGRFVDFAVPKGQPFTFYAATASGGLWKTINNGQTFEPIFDQEIVFSMGDIAVAPSNPEIIWVGTGEANNSRSSYWGNGVYKSMDSGKSWKNMGLAESHHIGRIVIHPKNPDIIYVAALGHLYSENEERGLYKSLDGGMTWNKVLEVMAGERFIGVVDVVMDTRDADTLYAASYDKDRKPHMFRLGGPGSRIYKTINGGVSWTMLEGGLPEGMLGRIGLTVYPKNSDVVFACIENANKPEMSDEEREKELMEGIGDRGMIDGEVYRSDDAGETWRKISPEGKSIGGAPGYYYGQIIVDPNDDNVIHVLSAASWGTRDGGKTWQRRPLRFGGDDHALWIDPENSDHILLGYDHGMGISFDRGKNWYHPDFLPLAQFYAVGVDMSFPYRVAGGTQDNGSWMGPSTKPGGRPIRLEDWQNVGGGDGMYNVFDWETNRYLYNEWQFGPLVRTDLMTGERKNIAYQEIDKEMRWNWNSPILVSPHDSDTIYHCGNKIVKSTNRGDSWEILSPDLTTHDPFKMTTGKGGPGNIQYCTITAMDESPLIKGLYWAGTDDGNVWVSRDGGKNWLKLNHKIPDNPEYWVSRIVASHHDPATVYLSYTGYRRDDFRPFLYKSSDQGYSWKSIAGNLPDEPINVIREDHRNPDLLFVGTEFGVYVSLDGGNKWTCLKNNMPTQPVHDLALHPREDDLIVATHGRGFYIADISPLQELNNDVLSKNVYLFDIESKIRWVEKRINASSSSNFNGESEPNGIVIYYYLKTKAKDEIKISIYKGNVLINELKSRSKAGINKVVWDMTRRRLRNEEEREEALRIKKLYESYGYPFRGDIDYIFEPALLGEYIVELTVGDEKFIKTVSILQDHWFENRSY